MIKTANAFKKGSISEQKKNGLNEKISRKKIRLKSTKKLNRIECQKK